MSSANIDFSTGQLRPVWRGRLHMSAAMVALPAGGALVHAAHGMGRVAAAVFAVAMTAVYAVSATYHRLARTPTAQQWLRRLDHSMIYVLIAGTYTPVCLLAMERGWGTAILAAVWLGAAVGVVLALTWRARRLAAALYLVLGWLAVAAMPAGALSGPQDAMTLLMAGGVAYTVGAVLFFTRRPRLAPATFGYHELWHTFTLVAGAAHFAAVAILVT